MNLRHQSKKGFLSLSIRSLGLHALQVVSVLLLSKWLNAEGYGIYGILNGYISVSWFLCDIGIGGALIQSSEEPSEQQLKSCAAIQVGLASFFSLAFWLLAPWITHHHQLPSSGVWMMRCLALSIPLYALRGVPKLLYDRKMDFTFTSRIELLEGLITYAVQILLAVIGAGAWSFILANLSRALFGTSLLLSKQKKFYWPRLYWKSIQPLLPFGLSFQANALVPALRGLIIPLVIGTILSTSEVGLITWTIGLSSIPLALAGNFNQVFFSSLSRARQNPDEFWPLASRSYELALFGIAFIFSFGAALGPTLIPLLFNSRWHGSISFFQIAILSFSLYTARYLGSAILNASGKPSLKLKIELIAIVLEYFSILISVKHWGPKGYFYAMAGVNTLLLILTFMSIRVFIRRETFVRFFSLLIASTFSVLIVQFTIHDNHVLLKTILFTLSFFSFSFLLNRSCYHDFMWGWRTLKNSLNPVS